MKIELTEQQTNRLNELRNDALYRVGLNCEPANFAICKDAIGEFYKIMKIPMPEVYTGTQKEYGNFMWQNYLKSEKQKVSFYSWIKQGVNRIKRDTKNKPTLISDFENNPVKKSFQSHFSLNLSQCFYGQHEFAWVAYYDFCNEIGVKITDKQKHLLGIWKTIAENGGWWYPFKEFLWICDRPEIQKIEELRLHNDEGPAIKLRCGHSIYVIHGVTVPEQVVMDPKSQSITDITEETNQEVRRIRIERYGWPEFLSEIKAKCLDRRKNRIENTIEALFSCNYGTVLVTHCPSTGRVYALEVDDGCTTTTEAQSYLGTGSTISSILKVQSIGRT